MRMALNGIKKLCFIDGSLPQPPTGNPDYSTWSRCNDVVRSLLMNSVSKTIGQSILFVKNAHAIWENLSKRFKQNNSPRLYHIEQQLYLLRQGSMDICEEIKTTQATRAQIIMSDHLPDLDKV